MKAKKILAIFLAMIMSFSLLPTGVMAAAIDKLDFGYDYAGRARPTITIDAPDLFVPGESFEFDITSDMDGLLTVSVGGAAGMAAEGDQVLAGIPFTVVVREMPSVESSDIVVTVRPFNPEPIDLATAAVTGVEMFTVTADYSRGFMKALTAPAASAFNMYSEPEVNWEHIPLVSSANQAKNTISVEDDGSITLSSTGDSGKIASTEDSINFYYTEIATATDFRLSADMTVSAINATNNQCAAGLMIRSEITTGTGSHAMFLGGLLNNNNGTSFYPYASRVEGASLSKAAATVSNTTLLRNFKIEIIKIGNDYAVTVDGVLYNISKDLLFVGDTLYIGAFTARNATATFSNLSVEILDETNTVESLEITRSPAETTFIQNTIPDWSDMEITAHWADDTSSVVSADEYGLSGLNSLTVGSRNAIVTYRGKSVAVPYEVINDYTIDIYMAIPPLKLSYAIGEPINSTGMMVVENKVSGKQIVLANTGYSLSTLDSSTPGVKTITVTRTGANDGGTVNLTTTFNVTVVDKSLEKIEITTLPRKTTYYVGDASYFTDSAKTSPISASQLLSGMIVSAVYSDNTKQILPMDSSVGYEVTYVTAATDFVNSAGTSNVKISYSGKEAIIDFTILAVQNTGLVASKYPAKTTYFVGDTLSLDGMEVRELKNDGSLGDVLTINIDYEARANDVNMGAAGQYRVALVGMGTYAGLSGEVPITVRESSDYSEGWKHTVFGQSASKENNKLTMYDTSNPASPVAAPSLKGKIGDNIMIDLNTLSGAGKIADGHDGINFYYRKLGINDNFKLTADVKVMTFSNPDGTTAIYGQEAFGLMLRDSIGRDEDIDDNPDNDANIYYDSVMFAGARGSLSWSAFTRDNTPYYESGMTTTNSAITGTGGTVPSFVRKPAAGSESMATITIERKNNNFTSTITVGGSTRTFSRDNNIPLDYNDPDHIYVGFFTARNAHIQFSNMELTVTDSASDMPGPEIVAAATTPAVTIRSLSDAASIDDYELIFSTNADGKATVYYNSVPIRSDMDVKAYELYKIPQTLSIGNANGFSVEFYPDVTKEYSSYSGVLEQRAVTAYSGLDTIYVSPNASEDGAGTSTNPMSFAEAVKKIAPGGTIWLKQGSYAALSLPRYRNGQDGRLKKVFAESGVVVQSVNLEADFWHVRGFEVNKGSFSISGSDNVIEMILQHGASNTGMQISRGNADSKVYDRKEMWPSRNIILNCEAYDNRDPSENDADGFAAKLTSGEDNQFIGCIAHHNIDDGWDLYAKGSLIGANILDGCIAYSNGHTLAFPDTNGGDGNGFKLGGEGKAVNHVIKNSIAFYNKSAGYTSNSNPTLTAINNVSFDNYGANVIFDSYDNIPTRDYQVENFFSFRIKNGLNSSDRIQKLVDGVFTNDQGRVVENGLVQHSIYLYNSSAETSTNDLGRAVTSSFFKGVVPPAGFETADTVYGRDTSGAGNISNIDYTDFLKLTDLAYLHIPVKGVSLNKADVRLGIGESERLIATISPADASIHKLEWSSDHPEVATVDGDGAVLAVAAGETVITVATEDGDFKATCLVTVTSTPGPDPDPSPSTDSDSSDDSAVEVAMYGPPAPLNRPFAASDFNMLFKDALAKLVPGEKNLTIRANNFAEFKEEDIKHAAKAAKDAGVTLTIHFDQVENGAVVLRISVNPADVTGSLNLGVNSARTGTVKALFTKWFKNNMAVAVVGKQGQLGYQAQVAVKPDKPMTNPVVYTYDAASNTYSRLANANLWIDINGYVHYSTTVGGEHIISDGPLVLK